jgi:peptide-methionine (S)-S-oxide reductase
LKAPLTVFNNRFSMKYFGLMFISLTVFAQDSGKAVHMEKATFGGGCFWCVEAIYQRLPGVQSVLSGYAGGTKPNPTYEEVCTGETGHAEVAQITYDPTKITYEQLLSMFWQAHDPTTLNRQGADAGTQYRSVIFYHDEKQKAAAEKSKAEAQKSFDDPIVTEIQPLSKFYPAENYHQDYYRNHTNAPYCAFIIKPKLKKLKLE